MRKVDVTRLARKIERTATELQHDVGRLRSAGHGPTAEALARCSRQLEEISRRLGSGQVAARQRQDAPHDDITEVAKVVGKRPY